MELTLRAGTSFDVVLQCAKAVNESLRHSAACSRTQSRGHHRSRQGLIVPVNLLLWPSAMNPLERAEGLQVCISPDNIR